VIVEARADAGGDDLLATLGLPAPRATVILNGSTAECDPAVAGVLGELAAAVKRERLTVVTGGTDAGIFHLFGAAMTDPTAPLVGVAPRDRAGVALEPHHTHVVVVEGDAWGDETPALLALADALGRLAPSVAVICGGGEGTRAEVAGHQRAGRPIVAVAASGGAADELAGVAPDQVVEAVLRTLGV
jgi:predicted Rossmann-fold nucleotide-binding protein